MQLMLNEYTEERATHFSRVLVAHRRFYRRSLTQMEATLPVTQMEATLPVTQTLFGGFPVKLFFSLR